MLLNHVTLGAVSMVFVGMSLLFMLFVVLGGSTTSSPLNSMWFLQATTAGITGARPVSQWNFFYICGYGNTQCGPAVPAIPFGYAWATNPSFAPGELVGDQGSGTTSRSYYLMWRFGWVFYLLSFIFNWITFFAGFLACFGRLGSAVSALLTLVTLFFYTLAVSLMSATFVKARNAFLNNNRSAQIGSSAFGLSWAAWFFLIFAFAIYVVGIRSERSQRPRRGSRRSTKSNKSGSPKGSSELPKHPVREEYA